jgi:hypothetical protein
MLCLRLIDRQTGRAPTALEPGHWDLALTKRGESHYRHEDTPPDLLGCISFKTDPGTYDLVLHFATSGFVPARLTGVVVPEAGKSEEAVVYLDRGVDVRLNFDSKLDWPSGHIVFLLQQGQLGMVEGPLSDEDGTATIRINGLRLRLEDSTLMNQRVEPVEGGVRTMRGLVPGRYQLRAFPDNVAFEPDSIDLFTTPEQPIDLHWRLRK